MNEKALFSLSYGLFVLSAKYGEKDNACIVNTVVQVADNPIRIAVSVNKANLTCEMIEKSGKFAAAVIDNTAPFELFKRFGFVSGRNTDKFSGVAARRFENGLLYPTEHISAALSCRVLDEKDIGSHKLFIAELEDASVLSGKESATYAFYHSSIKPKPPTPQKSGWICKICGYVHESDDLPEDFICPICKHPASDFEKTVISSAENKADSIKNTNDTEIKGENNMKKYVCSICGYVHEGDLPEDFVCPTCKAPASKFNEQKEGAKWRDEHVVGVAQGVDPEIIEGLRMNFTGECTEVGMYLAMARVAHREGYPEIGLYWEKAAWEEAEHASKFAELLGEVVTDSTKKNLEMRVDAESGACDGKFELAKRAKELGLDAIHDTVHEMAKDEARHGRAFEGLLKRYFG